MDPALLPLAAASLAFAGGHFLLSSAPVRGPLVGLLGEGPFRAVYSVLMIAALGWMIVAYGRTAEQTADTRLWDAGLLGPPVVLIFNYFAVVFLLCSLTTLNPTLYWTDGLHRDVAPGRGIYAVTRHPMLSAFALWSSSHLFVRGDMAGIVFFGAFLVLSTLGMVHLDARRRARADDAWRSFEAGTSRLPFRAILEGRRSFEPGEIGWWRIAAGTALYLAILYVHETVFGMNLFPVYS